MTDISTFGWNDANKYFILEFHENGLFNYYTVHFKIDMLFINLHHYFITHTMIWDKNIHGYVLRLVFAATLIL